MMWTRRVATALCVAAGALCVVPLASAAAQDARSATPLPDNVPQTPPPPPPGADAALDSARREGSLVAICRVHLRPG